MKKINLDIPKNHRMFKSFYEDSLALMFGFNPSDSVLNELVEKCTMQKVNLIPEIFAAIIFSNQLVYNREAKESLINFLKSKLDQLK